MTQKKKDNDYGKCKINNIPLCLIYFLLNNDGTTKSQYIHLFLSDTHVSCK